MEVTQSATLMTVASAWRNEQKRQADVMWQDDGRTQVVHRHNQNGDVVACSTQSVEALVRDLLEEFVKNKPHSGPMSRAHQTKLRELLDHRGHAFPVLRAPAHGRAGHATC
jgi:hypothetical protein